MRIVSAPRVVASRRQLAPGAVVIEDGRIAGVLDRRPARGPEHLWLDRGVLAPGLIDLQLNGAFGVDLVDADEAGWERVLCGLPSTGVTAVLATFISAPVADLAAAMARARSAKTAAAGRPGGSRLLGVHLEGPFLSPRRRGAHDAGHLVDPTAERVDRLMEAGAEVLSLVTLAPEREGAIEATKRLSGAGVLVSVGHSDALAEQVAAAAEAGARMVTHVFNAQRGLHHREPGVAGQALADTRLACGLIADLHHVHPAICRVVMEAARGRVALVTDAVSALGMPPGRYELGSEVVELHEGSPPLRADGTLAGSTLRLDEAVGNVVGIGIDPVRAVGAATRVPAELLGLGDLGRIEPGARADLVWLSESWRAMATWVGGVEVWRAEPAAGPAPEAPAGSPPERPHG
jgi:N-acetylglucosamine-6-phosphate deacetylase